MQNNVVKAFRQRLVRGGFTDIYIYDNGDGSYSVGCTSPDGDRIRRRMFPVDMYNTPHLVWFD